MQQLWELKPELAPQVGKLRAMKGVLALGGRQISESGRGSDEERRLHDADRLVDALDAPDKWLLAHVVCGLLGLPTAAVVAVAAEMRAPQQDWRRPTRVNFDVFLRSQARRQWRSALLSAERVQRRWPFGLIYFAISLSVPSADPLIDRLDAIV